MTELERLEERLQAYHKTEQAILSGQSYSIAGKTLTRANLAEVRTAIRELENKIKKHKNNSIGRKTKRIIPID